MLATATIATVRTEVDVRDGRPVLVRRGAGAATEADVLRRIAGPGVPEVLETLPDALVTTWAAPLSEPFAPSDLASVAAAVARAHELGVVHGPFAAEHLRCGPLVAGWAGPPDGWTQADDVASFGVFLPDALAARASAELAARPTMAALAAALRPTPTEVRPADRPPRRRMPGKAVIAACALSLGLVAIFLRNPGSDAAPPPPSTATSGATSTTTTSAPVATAPGGVVLREGRRWQVGEPDDVVVLGRWSCGEPLPAVLRPSTGQVWRFDDWAGAARALTIRPGVVALDRRSVGGCDRLLVVHADGRRTEA